MAYEPVKATHRASSSGPTAEASTVRIWAAPWMRKTIDYVYHLACWTIAFAPGFLALLLERPPADQGAKIRNGFSSAQLRSGSPS